jgi:hypothetical protein
MYALVTLNALALNEFCKGVTEGYDEKFLHGFSTTSASCVCHLAEHQGFRCNAWQIASCSPVFWLLHARVVCSALFQFYVIVVTIRESFYFMELVHDCVDLQIPV